MMANLIFHRLCWLVIALLLSLAPASRAVMLFEFTGLHRHIPDYPQAGLIEVRQITSELLVADVNVRLKIGSDSPGNPVYNGDLYAYLTHDSGFAVLFNRVGRRIEEPPAPDQHLGYGDNGFDLTLDDEAANGDLHTYRQTVFGNHTTALGGPLTDLTLAGPWAPDGRATDPGLVVGTEERTALLRTFRGLPIGGTWTLFLADLHPGGQATLEEWALVFTPVPEPALTLPVLGLCCGLWAWGRRRGKKPR